MIVGNNGRTLALLLLFLSQRPTTAEERPERQDSSQSVNLQGYAMARLRDWSTHTPKAGMTVLGVPSPRLTILDASVATFPGEFLFWLDVVEPIRNNVSLPSDCGKYEAQSERWDQEIVFFEYSLADSPKVVKKDTKVPTPFLIPVTLLFSSPRECTWVRTAADANSTRATLLLNRAARERQSGKLGTLRLVTVYRLQRDDKGTGFNWLIAGRDAEFVAAPEKDRDRKIGTGQEQILGHH